MVHGKGALAIPSVDDPVADFEHLAAQSSRRLFGLAMTILADPGEAEDAVQETLFSAWRSWAKLRDLAKRDAWLTRICVNQCIDRRRATMRKAFWTDDEPIPPVERKPFEVRGEMVAVQQAYLRLTTRQRAVFALHFQHGYTLEECAVLLGCRPGTARSHLG